MDLKTGRTTNFENLFAINNCDQDITHHISEYHGNLQYIGKYKANEILDILIKDLLS